MDYTNFGYNRFLTKPILQGASQSYFDALQQYQAGAVGTSVISDKAIVDEKVSDVSAEKITAGTIEASLYVGSQNLLMDGENNRYVVSDGTDNRIIIGYLSGAF